MQRYSSKKSNSIKYTKIKKELGYPPGLYKIVKTNSAYFVYDLIKVNTNDEHGELYIRKIWQRHCYKDKECEELEKKEAKI